jgi:DNA-binding PadR family transcriptional regulator
LAYLTGETQSSHVCLQAEQYVPLTESTYLIMLSLIQPMHGYGVMQEVKELTGGVVRLGPGTMYGALAALQERKMIEPVEPAEPVDGAGRGRQRKEYVLTALGHEVLRLEQARLQKLADIGREVMGYGAKQS